MSGRNPRFWNRVSPHKWERNREAGPIPRALEFETGVIPAEYGEKIKRIELHNGTKLIPTKRKLREPMRLIGHIMQERSRYDPHQGEKEKARRKANG